ncbi:flagellar biosynthetic protein FliO [Halobacillus sp. B23F22_1]|uniref:flagellar biosynthetic protein FliO n=1 Tax=Halobacillus sp. B23F22_1 TaxID=3459514 RepID=UPI00373F96C6
MKRTFVAVITALLLSIFVVSFSSPSLAAPSVSECTENPDMEGCGSISSPGEGEGTSDESTADSEESPSLLWNILKLIFALFVVLALIYGLLKFFNKRSRVFQKNRTMETLGGITLAPNRSLQAVRIGEKYFVVGVGDSIDLITEITDEKTIDSLSSQEEVDFMNKGVNQLKQLSRKRNSESTYNQSSTVQFQKLFQTQLEEMKKKRRSFSKREDDSS